MFEGPGCRPRAVPPVQYGLKTPCRRTVNLSLRLGFEIVGGLLILHNSRLHLLKWLKSGDLISVARVHLVAGSFGDYPWVHLA